MKAVPAPAQAAAAAHRRTGQCNVLRRGCPPVGREPTAVSPPAHSRLPQAQDCGAAHQRRRVPAAAVCRGRSAYAGRAAVAPQAALCARYRRTGLFQVSTLGPSGQAGTNTLRCCLSTRRLLPLRPPTHSPTLTAGTFATQAPRCPCTGTAWRRSAWWATSQVRRASAHQGVWRLGAHNAGLESVLPPRYRTAATPLLAVGGAPPRVIHFTGPKPFNGPVPGTPGHQFLCSLAEVEARAGSAGGAGVAAAAAAGAAG